MKYTSTTVELGSITVGENPRIPNRMALASLTDNIMGVGLLEPLTVWDIGKGMVQVVKGHRRAAAINSIKANDPKRFNELFGKGIPCFKVTDVSPEEIVALKLDHSEQLTLSDPHEVQRSANMLFAIGKTEADVAVMLAGMIDKISPMKPKAREELAAKEAALAKAKADGNAASAELCQRDIRDFIFQYRRGFVQNLHAVYRCPNVVMAALYFKACNEKPKGYEKEYLPPITTSDAVSLYKVHSEDCKELENGISKYNKEITGPKFNAKWAELCEKRKAAEGEVQDARPKAMSAKEMDAEMKGNYKSELAVKLTRRHMGDKEITDIAVLDDASYRADLVRRNDPKAWADFVKFANVIEAKQKEAVKASTPAKA